MGGIKCLACRRYVLRWPHMILLVLIVSAAVLGLLEFLFRFI